MTADDRIMALRERHAALESQITEESSRPLPDELLLHSLKRQKLCIKDEIARLAHA